MSLIEETLSILNDARARSPSILVAFSGGKDSLCVLDLCLRTFKHVEAFFMYSCPGLECENRALDAAEQRWGIVIHRVPHWGVTRALRGGAHGFPDATIAEMKLKDVYDLISAETRIPYIASGAKKADSLWRKRTFANWATQWNLVYPLMEWSKLDVLSYLRARGIPLPDSSGRSATGIDLSTPSILWLHDKYPEDFARLERLFPFARAVVYRRDWFGGR